MSRQYGRRSYGRDPRRYQPRTARGSCLFCQTFVEAEVGHSRNQCPLFKSLKRMTSPNSYIDVQLKPNDEAGYASAGILPWRRVSGQQVEFLLAREYRTPSRDRGGDLLNFLGGKRHKRETDALTCAADKVDDETGLKLSRATIAHMRDSCPLVCWSNDSKYVLYLFELVGEDDREIDVRCAGIGGTKRLEWATRDTLLNSRWTLENFHGFAREMLLQLTACNIMMHLEQLFDTAFSASNSTSDEAQKPPPGKGPAEIAEHFDIVGAIRSSLTNMRPDHPNLPPLSHPTFPQLYNAMQAIPKVDIRKLKLRFHPDRLCRCIGRQPTDIENALSTSVMQILNGLHDPAGAKDVMESLRKVTNTRRNLVVVEGEAPDTMKAMRDLLADLNI